VFGDQAMTLAAIDRLVHYATILEMNVDSYRRKEAVDKARGAGRPPNARDNEDVILIVAPRQPNVPVTQISLALSSGRDNDPPAATAEMAILIVAVFPSRLSRYRMTQNLSRTPSGQGWPCKARCRSSG
jgi:hypothetical protein